MSSRPAWFRTNENLLNKALAAASGPPMTRLADLSDKDLARTAPMKLPTQDPTVRGIVAFFGYHEACHVGQIAYLRKRLGYPGLVDGQ